MFDLDKELDKSHIPNVEELECRHLQYLMTIPTFNKLITDIQENIWKLEQKNEIKVFFTSPLEDLYRNGYTNNLEEDLVFIRHILRKKGFYVEYNFSVNQNKRLHISFIIRFTER